MNKLNQFRALVCHVRDNPQVIAPHGEEGKRILSQMEEACLNEDVSALTEGIDSFLALLMGERTMEGLSPVDSQEAIEQFNSIQKVTRAVLDKLEE